MLFNYCRIADQETNLVYQYITMIGHHNPCDCGYVCRMAGPSGALGRRFSPLNAERTKFNSYSRIFLSDTQKSAWQPVCEQWLITVNYQLLEQHGYGSRIIHQRDLEKRSVVVGNQLIWGL